MKQSTALVSLQEICELLNRSRDEVITLCEQGKCPHIRYKGELYKFPKDQVLKVIKPRPEKEEEEKKAVSAKGTTAKKGTREKTKK